MVQSASGHLCCQSNKTYRILFRDIFPLFYSIVRCIIDRVEFKVVVASSLTRHKMLYSDYKIHTTVKVVIGIMPGCGLSFVSFAFPGGDSDKSITVKIALLNTNLWEPGNKLTLE